MAGNGLCAETQLVISSSRGKGGGWIKRLLSERRRNRNEKGTLLAYHHLPRDFCKREAIAVTMQEVEGR